MFDLLKLIGKGALTIVLLPLIAVYFVIILLVSLINHLVHEVITIIHFFKGQNITFKDDLQVRYEQIMARKEAQFNREMIDEYHSYDHSEVDDDAL